MKKTLLSIFAFSGLLASAQLTDLPLTANQTNIYAGQNVQITTTGSDIGVTYNLRNSNNSNIGTTKQGTGNNLVFNTGALALDESYNVFAYNSNMLQFDSGADYINFGTNNRGIDTAVTVAAWIKTPSAGGLQNIVLDYGANDAGFILRMDANQKVQFSGRDGTNNYKTSGNSSASVANNLWHYIVGTANINTGVWSIYVDGVLENSANEGVGNSLSNSDALYIGSDFSTSDAFEGNISGVTIWSKELTLAEISANMNTCLTGSEPDIVGHFKLDAGTGTVINDYSNTAINGNLYLFSTSSWATDNTVPCLESLQMTQIVNVTVNQGMADLAVTATTPNITSGGNSDIVVANTQVGLYYTLRDDNSNTVVEGPYSGTSGDITFNTGAINSTTTYNVYVTNNNAIEFSSNSHRVNLTTNSRGIDKEVTVAAWVKTTTSNGLRNIVLCYGGGNGYILRLDGNGKAYFSGRDGTANYKSSGLSTTDVTDGQWHYLVGTSNVNTGLWSIYVDGVLENSASVGVGITLLPAGYLLQIGGTFSSSNAFDGELMNVTIWDTVITASEVTTNMSNCLVGNEPNIVGHFPLKEGFGSTIFDKSTLAINGTTNIYSNNWNEGNENCIDDMQMTQTATVNVGTVGINEINSKSLSIYPNPTKNKLTIKNNQSQILNISIINITGKTVKTIVGNATTVNVADLKQGIYFLQVQTENGLFNSKFIKE